MLLHSYTGDNTDVKRQREIFCLEHSGSCCLTFQFQKMNLVACVVPDMLMVIFVKFQLMLD